jgi:hypothetical protein
MTDFPYQDDIELSKLKLDLKNPRVATDPDNQREAIEALAAEQKGKLLALARHIAHNGLSPAQRFIVIPDEDNYIVLDANRRLVALKALERPDTLHGFLTDNQMVQLRTLADDYAPPDAVACVVFEKRDDANVWVELLHEGQGDGHGLVDWTAHQKARHRSRREASTPPHMQLLDFVIREGKVSAEAIGRNNKGTYPVSTLARALTTPRVRERLGIEIVNGKVVTAYPKVEVLKGLTKLVDQIGTGAVKVGDLMSKEDRARYVDNLSATDLPDPTTRTAVSAPLDEAPDTAAKAEVKVKPKDRRPSSARIRMIPNDFSVEITVSRINDIYHELRRKLLLKDAPNAIAVLFRVFFELSVDDYIRRNAHLIKLGGKTLEQKANGVLDDLETSGTVGKKEMLPVREALRDANKLTLVTNLNAFVHNPHMTPSANDLRAVWDKFQRLIEVLWA